MILTTAAIIAQASPTPDPAVVARARAWLDSLAAGKILDASALTDEMKNVLTPDALAGGATTLAGGIKTFDFVHNGTMQGNSIYVFRITTGKGAALNFVYATDVATGKISGLALRPATSQ